MLRHRSEQSKRAKTRRERMQQFLAGRTVAVPYCSC
jgi:hypothetical protein